MEAVLERSTGETSLVRSRRPCGGGCINQTKIVETEDGRRFFVKSNPAPLPHMFEREAEGLAALAAPGVIRVPAPVGCGGGTDGVPPFLVLEFIESARPKTGFQTELGRRLAQLHRATTSGRFGFLHDNYIGSTPQPNGWMTDWVAFWRERRLGFQLQLARRHGLLDAELERLGARLMDRLDDLLGQPEEPACLLHGDLWGGNYMTDERGEPVLIDPATYFGRREADLAMTMLFGGFDREFYRAYEEVWPLPPDSAKRLEVYKLYHLLNHLNIFGGVAYLPSILRTMERIAG
ncbi:fructosamine kinase family protein [Candidatus Poribacteria bacterium]|nr:fructosamine kinase family protein [Candidatus Poribacteria bacterium]